MTKANQELDKAKEIDELYSKFIQDEDTVHQVMYQLISEPDFKTDFTNYINKIENGKDCNKHNHVKFAECLHEHVTESIYNRAVSVVNG